MRLPPALPFALLLAACTQFPELEKTVDPDVMVQPYPALAPQADLLAAAGDSALEPEVLRAELSEKSAALARRAEAARAVDAGDEELAQRAGQQTE